jgi:hypothetical protein
LQRMLLGVTDGTIERPPERPALRWWAQRHPSISFQFVTMVASRISIAPAVFGMHP